MAIRVHDMGELGYGGLVMAAEWWDDKRIAEGKITKKEVLKQASFYGYLVPGGLMTLTSAFGFWRAVKPWDEHISHGFIYDFPRFVRKMVDAMKETEAGRSSDAVKEAQRILQERQRIQLGAGLKAGRSYQKEFETVAPYAF